MRRRTTPLPPVPDCDQVDDVVLAWRTEQFIELGFTVAQAALLADIRHDDTPLDWHRAEALVRAGCSHKLAAAILQ